MSSMRTWLRKAATDYERVSRGLPGEATAASTAGDCAKAGPGTPSFAATAVASLARHYRINTALLPSQLAGAVQPLTADAATHDFLASCKPDHCRSCLASLLRRVMSVTDTNGLLGRGGMFVLSEAHVAELLRPMSEERVRRGDSARLGRLLDVGAGDGGVTAAFAPLFREVHATEVSRAMLRRLAAAGYRAMDAPFLSREAFPEDGAYDVVSVLNVLDRCDHPADLLASARRLVQRRGGASGRVVLAVVLPFSEFVEEGTVRRGVHGPLPMRGARCGDGASFEASLSALLTRAILPAGLAVERIARVPYLCRGDSARAYYVLSDAIIVCRPAEDAAATVAGSVGAGAAAAGAGAAHSPAHATSHRLLLGAASAHSPASPSACCVPVAVAANAGADDVAAAASASVRLYHPHDH